MTRDYAKSFAGNRLCRVNSDGFTLLELMITVACIAILASIAIASYEFAMVKARRGSAQACLTEHAQYMERYHSLKMSYWDPNDVPASPSCPEIASSYTVGFGATSDARQYFLIEAKPIGRQAQADSTCGTLAINEVGQKTAGGSDCW